MRAFRELHPASAATVILSAAGVTMSTMHPVMLLLSLVGAIALFCTLCRDRITHLIALVLFLLSALINPIFVHRGMTVLFFVNDMPVTLEAALWGVAAGVMIAAVYYWFRVFTVVMTSDRLLALTSLLSAKLTLVLSMALRMVPMLRARFCAIRDAQRAVGLYRDQNLVDRVRGGLRVFSALAGWILENGIITAQSMEARGWGVGRRSRYMPIRFTSGDGGVILISAVLLGLTIAGLWGHAVEYYPVLSLPDASAPLLIGILSFGVLCALPTLLNIKEAIKWRLLLSKT